MQDFPVEHVSYSMQAAQGLLCGNFPVIQKLLRQQQKHFFSKVVPPSLCHIDSGDTESLVPRTLEAVAEYFCLGVGWPRRSESLLMNPGVMASWLVRYLEHIYREFMKLSPRGYIEKHHESCWTHGNCMYRCENGGSYLSFLSPHGSKCRGLYSAQFSIGHWTATAETR